jgi:hypothetical protein
VEVQREQRVRVWRNVGAGTAQEPAPLGTWAAIRLEQPGANRDGIGAWLDVTVDGVTTNRQVTVGGGHAGGQIGWIHLGLGGADEATVQVRWPDGTQAESWTVRAGTFATLARGAAEPQLWTPR